MAGSRGASGSGGRTDATRRAGSRPALVETVRQGTQGRARFMELAREYVETREGEAWPVGTDSTKKHPRPSVAAEHVSVVVDLMEDRRNGASGVALRAGLCHDRINTGNGWKPVQ